MANATNREPRPASDADAGSARAASARADGLTDDSPVFLPPLKPHRKLLVGTAAVLAVWLGFLVYLYATTIYPRAGQARQIAPPQLVRPPSSLRELPGSPRDPSGPPHAVPRGPAGEPGDPSGELLRPSGPPTTRPSPIGPVGPIGPVPR